MIYQALGKHRIPIIYGDALYRPQAVQIVDIHHLDRPVDMVGTPTVRNYQNCQGDLGSALSPPQRRRSVEKWSFPLWAEAASVHARLTDMFASTEVNRCLPRTTTFDHPIQSIVISWNYADFTCQTSYTLPGRAVKRRPG